MPTRAMGPTFAGGEEPILHETSGYRMTFLPDVNNPALQAEGQNPVFYWVPNIVRLARKNGPSDGDYLFNLIRFAGTQSSEGTVGAAEDREVAGGIVSFSVTSGPPDEVLAEMQQQITERWQGESDYFWGIRNGRQPIFRPAIVRSNNVSVSNLSPNASGGVPVPEPLPEGPARFAVRGGFGQLAPRPSAVRQRDVRDASNLEPWFWQMQGEGAGSISPSGTNAFTALIGAYPAAILWEAFRGTSSPITVTSAMQLLAWTPEVELTIRGHWESIFQHFSAAASGRHLWFSADVQTEFNKLRKSGAIEVELKIDSTIPNGEEVLRKIEERADVVYDKFMDEARRVIFEPPPPEVAAAEASAGSLGIWGAGLALKYRRDQTNLDLYYHEEHQLAYLQNHVASGSLSGMLEEMAADPEAEGKYFRTVYLDDWPKKLARVVKPVVNWNDGAVAFVSAQIGYVSTAGDIRWEGQLFQPTDPATHTWKYSQAQKEASDVSNAPEGWETDETFVKRSIHMNEPPNPLDDPYNRVQIDQNQIDIDPGENGTLLNDITLEVRSDTAGRVAVGPIGIAAVLADNTQTVEVVMEPTDDQGEPIGREPVKFSWTGDDQERDRFWTVYSGDPDFRAFYRYKVRVLVKGSIFEPGMEWEGPWVATSGNGPLTISMPMRGEEGVTVTRSKRPAFRSREEFARAREAQEAPNSDSSLGETREAPATRASVDVEPTYRGWPVARASDGGGRA